MLVLLAWILATRRLHLVRFDTSGQDLDDPSFATTAEPETLP
jgi:hypothetical protein